LSFSLKKIKKIKKKKRKRTSNLVNNNKLKRDLKACRRQTRILDKIGNSIAPLKGPKSEG